MTNSLEKDNRKKKIEFPMKVNLLRNSGVELTFNIRWNRTWRLDLFWLFFINPILLTHAIYFYRSWCPFPTWRGQIFVYQNTKERKSLKIAVKSVGEKMRYFTKNNSRGKIICLGIFFFICLAYSPLSSFAIMYIAIRTCGKDRGVMSSFIYSELMSLHLWTFAISLVRF